MERTLMMTMFIFSRLIFITRLTRKEAEQEQQNSIYMKTIIFLALVLLCSLAQGQETFTIVKVDTVKQEYSIKALSEQRARLVQSAKELRIEIMKVDSLLKIGGVIIERQKKINWAGKVGISQELTTPLSIPDNVDAGLNHLTPVELLDISTTTKTIN